MADFFKTFEDMWQMLWEFIYKVYDLIKAE